MDIRQTEGPGSAFGRPKPQVADHETNGEVEPEPQLITIRRDDLIMTMGQMVAIGVVVGVCGTRIWNWWFTPAAASVRFEEEEEED